MDCQGTLKKTLERVVCSGKSNGILNYTYLITFDCNNNYELNFATLGFNLPKSGLLFSHFECSHDLIQKVYPSLFEFIVAHELSHPVHIPLSEYPTKCDEINNTVEELGKNVQNSELVLVDSIHSEYGKISDQIEYVARYSRQLNGVIPIELEIKSDRLASEIIGIDAKQARGYLADLKKLCLNPFCRQQIDTRIAAFKDG